MKTLESFEFGKASRKAKYDWDTLLDGSIWELEEVEDFSCKPSCLISAARVRAKKAGKTLRASKIENGVVLQAVVAESTATVPATEPVKSRRGRPKKTD